VTIATSTRQSDATGKKTLALRAFSLNTDTASFDLPRCTCGETPFLEKLIMLRRWPILVATLAVFASFLAVGRSGADQVVPKANWIWFDEGNPLREAPSGTIYFRKTFDEPYELQEADIHITCDNAFVLYINGKEIGRGNEWKDGKVFDVKPHLVRGKNVIAVRATNEGGPAGLVAWLVRLTKPGNHYTVLTDGSWKCSKEAPEGWREAGFDDSKWSSPKVLSEFVRPDRWAGVTWNGRPDSSRFTVKDGFTIDQVADHELIGSIVNMTFDAKGRPVVSRERGPILTLIDANNDGKFEKVKEYSAKVQNCQGLCAWDATTLYCIGDGPDGTGLYRLKDLDNDDTADSVELLHKFKGGMGEHGPHAVVAGPDGYLYINSGNHAWVTAAPEPGSPCPPYIDLGHLWKEPGVRNPAMKNQPADEVDRPVKLHGRELPLRDLLRGYEADVLPRYEDAGGHAVGIRVPGGTIWRTDPDGKHWTLETCGFRNQFDFAINSLGEVFSFDSDMEWDEFAPWYRPVRVNHCPPGADFGWRSGSNKWPSYYVDSLPATVDIGRGSPCGVVFYNHTAFGDKYHDTFFITDWSYGRIFAVHLKRDGATFKGDAEEFVTGKPLNVSDIEVAPDGSVFFVTGGRNTEGGVFRIHPTTVTLEEIEGGTKEELAVARALIQPQPQSAWGREAIRALKKDAGEKWEKLLLEVVNGSGPTQPRLRAISYMLQFSPETGFDMADIRQLAKDKDSEIRTQAAVLLARHGAKAADDLARLLDDSSPLVARRALEGLIRTQTPAPIEKLKPLLASNDRFLRYTARLALERVSPEVWRDAILTDKNPRVAIMGLVAINRVGLVATDSDAAATAFRRSLELLSAELPHDDFLDALRAVELTVVNTPVASRPDATNELGKLLLAQFSTGRPALDRELSRLIAALQVPGGVDKLLTRIEKIGATDSLDDRADAVHYARCLMGATDGWTWKQRERFLKWFDVSREWKGGHSYAGYITNFLRDTVKQLDEKELLAVVQNADQFNRAATRALAADERVGDKSDAAFVPALAALVANGDKSPVPRSDVILALGRTGRAEAEAILLRHYDQSSGELRDATVRALANFQNARNWPIFVRALDSENKETVRAAVQALAGIEQKPDGPAAFRAAIQAGGRLGEQGAWDSVVLLRQWGGKHFGHKRNEWRAELGKWQKWYSDTYPDAASAKLADSEKPKHNWSYDQLLAYLEGEGRSGSVQRGRAVFEKAICAKCHKIEQVGQSIGPDLTTLASRFKRKDILEATIYPSRVISDQYKSYLVATKDGRVITAMKAPDDGDNYVLLLSDATTIKLPKGDVEEMVEGKQSVMPDGLMNQFTLQEIADLFAFLESGKAPAPAANGKP
jgi:putative membrane-bound dehydrogenase-like protein